MSNNPFESPQEGSISSQISRTSDDPKAMPGAVTAISIICLVLGILGLCFLCFQGLALTFQSRLMEFVNSMPQPPVQKEFGRLNMEAQQAMMIPAIVLMVINLFVAGLLVAGGIGCMKRKSSGRSTLRLGLLAAVFFSFLRLVLTIASYFVSSERIRNSVANYQGEISKEALESMVVGNNIGAIFGCVVGSLFTIALLGFYLWARFYLGKDKLDKFFIA